MKKINQIFVASILLFVCVFAQAQSAATPIANNISNSTSWRKAFGLGNDFFAKKDYSKAAEYYQYALGKRPKDARRII